MRAPPPVSEFLNCNIILFTIIFGCTIVGGIPYSEWCDSGNATVVDLYKSNDNVPGRYELQHCTQRDVYEKWQFELYYIGEKENECLVYDYEKGLNSTMHSASLPIQIDTICNNDTNTICFKYTLDLIFGGCYWVSSKLWKPSHLRVFDQSDTFHYVHNNITKQTYLSNKFTAQVIENKDTMSILWHNGNIPMTSFQLEICLINNTLPEECVRVESSACRRVGWAGAECAARRLRGRTLLLLLTAARAAWAEGGLLAALRRSHLYYTVAAGAGAAGARGGWALWAGAAAAALLLAALLLRVLRLRPRKRARYSHQPPRGTETLQLASAAGRAVLLVYASDVTAEGRLLADLLVHSGAQVWDVQSARCVALYAAGAGSWLRARLREPGLAVLLLQSPGLARPAATFADTLARLCSAHLADAPALPYHRYYIATAGAGAEQLAHVLPFTRYSLPADAAPLLRDLRLPRADLRHYSARMARLAAGDL